MRSIRHSLIVFFLVLLTFALGAVSWFSYRTTADALRTRQQDARQMIVAQCITNCDALRSELDRRLLFQARHIARNVRATTVHTECLHQLGLAAAHAMPGGPLHAIVWTAEVTPLPWSRDRDNQWHYKLMKVQPKITNFESEETDYDHGREYFQTFTNDSQTMQRSESLGEQSLRLTEEMRKKSALQLQEIFDDVELKGHTKARRVTLMWQVPQRSAGVTMKFGPQWRPPTLPSTPKGGTAKRSKSPGSLGFTEPVFIQYASDVGPLDAKIKGFERKRDEEVQQLEAAIDNDLHVLRSRMFWIVLATLGGIWLGGYGLIHIGLAPLAKMSEAVSKVTPQNFHLPLDARTLPQELQPIAVRLEEVLEQLRKAFAREKQASADISHELRTPLAALMTTLEVGLRKTRSSNEYRDILDECRASGQHMYQLVERLLTLARLDAGADQYCPTEVDGVEVALQCADLIRPLAKARGLDMRLHLPDPITLHTDPNKLREVLTNLLHNAVEYNRPNGSIELALERVNGHVRIDVRDTGIGIQAGTLEHIFERFYRADPSRHADTPHAGLGLAIVKSYIDLMGGTISVSSSDAGTVFTVELPAVEPAGTSETAFRSAAPA